MDRLSINWYLEKTIDLLEMSPLENQFQDFIVYPILDYIIHLNEVCEADVIDCHNFRQYNTVLHDRRKYSVLVKSVPDLLIAKDFFYRNREKCVYDALHTIASVEVKEPENDWMFCKSVCPGTTGEAEYSDALYLELLPSLVKNKKLILTNIRKWELFSAEKVKDKELIHRIELYVRVLEMCGFDLCTDYENKQLKNQTVKKRLDELEKIKEISQILSRAKTEYDYVTKPCFDEIVKLSDKAFLESIKKYIRQSHIRTFRIITDEERLNINRNSIYNSGNRLKKDIACIAEMEYNIKDYEALFRYLPEFLFADSL